MPARAAPQQPAGHTALPASHAPRARRAAASPRLRPRPGPTFPLSLFHALTCLAPLLAIPEGAGDTPALVRPAGASVKAPTPPHPFLQPESLNFWESVI